MEYKDIITTKRPENDGSDSVVYTDIEAEVMVDDKGKYNTSYSQADEVGTHFVFLRKEYLDIKESDRIYYTDDFGDEQILKVVARDFIDFSVIEPYIELICVKM